MAKPDLDDRMPASASSQENPRFACDAMCGGLARWLRALGYDATYTEGIDDARLVRHALEEHRILISSDGRLFERRLITTRRVRALRLPRGLKLHAQLEHVVRTLHLVPCHPRCTRCGGNLLRVRRDQVADRVPARSLLFADTFYQCESCEHVFWNGTHWNRINTVREKCRGWVHSETVGHQPE